MAENKKKISLRFQFLTRLFLVLLAVALITGAFQLYFINEQIDKDIEKQSDIIANSIEQGIEETNLASEVIEHQIDLKLLSISHHIADLLEGKSIDEINNEELVVIKDRLGLSGISLIIHDNNDDIVVAKSSTSEEIGFSLKEFPDVYENFTSLFNNQPPPLTETLSMHTDNAIILPIAQSGSHEGEPLFFKYAYYHPPGADYIIDPYIEANEVYKFTSEVGPDALIEKVSKVNPYVMELAVLDPRVFKDPSLEDNIYPPLKKVVYGDYEMRTEEDTTTLINMLEKPNQTSYVNNYHGDKVYKVFMPTKEGKVIYMALDYGELSGPLYRHSIILIISGLVSLVILFLLTARFFNRVYRNIQQIKKQIQLLETGDFTAKSAVSDNNELGELSESANKMVDTLHGVLNETSDQASQTQRLAVMLEAEAANSVEKMYTISMEKTSQFREQLDDITEFLDKLEEYINNNNQTEDKKGKEILEKIGEMRKVAKDRTGATTDTTLALSDLLKSLHGQSTELSNIANNLLRKIDKFKL
ncbi:methyl-accepting chemotaxis protein [Oceanobacillus salinisoli]|uniref:methyl-accepting chemotaxis protein n=1 Tax=Oceanobacillus salinisoli TaxID=2678611 RepID=UPI0012E2680E|nr:methyl-accepting chemotaxis protein [Oceanobacillus salinisoli]